MLKNKSFYDRCYENLNKIEANEIINRWDIELNKVKPEDVSYSSHKKYYFRCPKRLHESELKNINSFTNPKKYNRKSNLGCNKCNSIAQYLEDTYGQDGLEKYWSNKNTINPWELSKNNNKKIWIKCQKKDYHEDYLVTCGHFVTSKSRCPFCSHANGKVHPLDSLGQYIIDNYGQEFLDKIWSDKNKKSPYKYSSYSSQEVWWKCSDEKHKDYKRIISGSTIHKFRCPECSQERDESFLQEGVRKYLENLNYTILHEHYCTIIPKNPKTKYPLPFDNEIINLNLIIEIHGIQHYQITNFHKLHAKHSNTTPEQEFHYQKLKDRYKKFIAHIYGYEYLEIPYWTDDENETWKKLIDDKINKIITDKNSNLNEVLKKNKKIIQTRKLQKILEQKQNKIKKHNKIKINVPKRENFKGKNNPRALKIICLNTKEVFDYMKLASTKYNIDNSNITKCCKGKIKFCGKDIKTNKPLRWMYYEDYLKLIK